MWRSRSTLAKPAGGLHSRRFFAATMIIDALDNANRARPATASFEVSAALVRLT
jgi:hypothetical protein